MNFMYSAYSDMEDDIEKRSCDLPAPGKNRTAHRQALAEVVTEVINT
jgi:hypothetical protein